MRVIAHVACPFRSAQVLVRAQTATPCIEHIVHHRISGRWLERVIVASQFFVKARHKQQEFRICELFVLTMKKSSIDGKQYLDYL
jgi:hypothetical protein